MTMRFRVVTVRCVLAVTAVVAGCAGRPPVDSNAGVAVAEGCVEVAGLSPTHMPHASTRIAGAEGCLAGSGVFVASAPAKDIGTRHFADRLVVVAGGGRFERVSSDESGVYAPIVDRGVRLVDDRLLLLGWLHTSPEDTVVAMLFRLEPSSVILEDELIVDVGDTAVVLDLTGPRPRVGVIVPGCALSSTPPDDHACAVFDQEWGIRAKRITWTLPFLPTRFDAWTGPDEQGLYCPPFQQCAHGPVVDPRSVTWFEVGRDGFSAPPAP